MFMNVWHETENQVCVLLLFPPKGGIEQTLQDNFVAHPSFCATMIFRKEILCFLLFCRRN